MSFQFSGDPVSVAAAAKAEAARQAAQGQVGAAAANATGNWYTARENNKGLVDSTLIQQPALFGKNAVDLFNAYGKNAAAAFAPYADAAKVGMSTMNNMGSALSGLYGKGLDAYGGLVTGGMNALGALGAGMANATGAIGAANQQATGNIYGSANNAMANAFGAAMQGQAIENQAKAGAMGQIGAAGANSLGQLGAQFGAANQQALAELAASRNASLANQAVAQANGLGQLATSDYNLQGQLGTAMAQIAAAQAAAAPQIAKSQALASIIPGLLDTFRSGFGAMGGTPAIAPGGFQVTGPSGVIAEGTYDGSPPTPQPTSFNFKPPTMPALPTAPPTAGVDKAQDFIGSLLANSQSGNTQAALARQNMVDQFNANRTATMDNGVLNALNSNFDTGTQRYTSAIKDAGQAAIDAAKSVQGNYDSSGAIGAIGRNAAAGQEAMKSNLGMALGAMNPGMFDTMAGFVGNTINGSQNFLGDLIRHGSDVLAPLSQQTSNMFTGFTNTLAPAYNDLIHGMNTRYDQAAGGLNDLWNNSLGQNDMFMTPLQKAQRSAAAEDFSTQRLRDSYASGTDPVSMSLWRAQQDRAALAADNARRQSEWAAQWAAANPGRNPLRGTSKLFAG